MIAATRIALGCSLVLLAGASSIAKAQAVPEPLLKIDPFLVEDYQAGETLAQQALPYEDQRGTGLDGSLRSQAPFGWAVNANPYAHEWNAKARYREDIMLQTGRYSPTEIDLALPAPGFSWTIGRTYTIPEDVPDYTDNYTGPLGYQGLDWHQFSQPEIEYVARPGVDYIYLVYGADRFLEFRQLDETSDVYRGVNGAAGAVVAGVAGPFDEYGIFTYWDQNGTRSVFFDPDDSDNTIVDTDTFDGRGQLWTITDVAGNQAYVGHATDPEEAIKKGYDDAGRMQVAYDTANRKYEYSYTQVAHTGIGTIPDATLLTKVEVFEDYDNDTTWETTGSKVEYTYFSEKELSEGIFGNLEEVHITVPLSGYDPETPALRTQVLKQRYWYYTSNADFGYFVANLNAEGYRRFELEIGSPDVSYGTSGLRERFEFFVKNYYSDSTGPSNAHRRRFIQTLHEPTKSGTTGVSFYYDQYTTFSDTSGVYDPDHQFFVSINEGNVSGVDVVRYFDEAGQPLSEYIDGNSSLPDMWTYVVREDPATTNAFDGVIWKIAAPLSIASATENPGSNGDPYVPPCTIKSTNSSTTGGPVDAGGPVTVFDRETSTTSAFRGFMLADQWQYGGNPVNVEDGPHPVHSFTYLTPARNTAAAVDVGGYLVINPLISSFKRHPGIDMGSGAPAAEDTIFTYEFHAEDIGGGGTTDPADPQWLRYRKMDTALPVVSTAQLGSGVSEHVLEYRRADGTMVYARDPSGIWNYVLLENNQTVTIIEDADLGQTSAFAIGEKPADYIATVPSTSDAYHLVTQTSRDEIGRPTQVTLPNGRIHESYYSSLASGEFTEVWSAKTSGSTHYGPAQYNAIDHLGNQIVDAQIKFTGGSTTASLKDWVDTTASTPLVDAISEGELSSVNTMLIDPSGTLVWSNRSYHTLPLSGIGLRRLNFDEEWYDYGVAGRVVGTAKMNGTMILNDFDQYGFIDQTTIDSYSPGEGIIALGADYPSPGDYFPIADCPERCCIELSTISGPYGVRVPFIRGCDEPDGPSLAIGPTGDSFTQSDIQGRAVFMVNPTAPYEFLEYDNLGRLIAAATYSNIPSGSFTVKDPLPTSNQRITPDIFNGFDTRDDSPRTIDQYRTSLVEYEYTPRGQLAKVTRHNIDQSDDYGNSLGHLESLTAYDANGRAIYTNAGQNNKYSYNRIGQPTDSYMIATVDDTAGIYADLQNVTGDEVVSEQHMAIDPQTGNTLLSVQVDRVESSSGTATGALDSNNYSDASSVTISASNLNGRAQITTYTFDTLDRVSSRTLHGTGTGSSFDPSSPPSGGLTVSLTYGDDGRVSLVTDELGRVQKRTYDIAGNLTGQIDNYVTGIPEIDENRKSEWVYQDTQMIKYLAYVDDTTPQITTYSYESPHTTFTNPTWADINPTNDYLRQIIYPDGEEEHFFYSNAGQLSASIDRNGNEFEVTYDDSERPKLVELKKAGLNTNYNADVGRSIELGYDNRGYMNRIQEIAPNSPNALSSVYLEYDGWGALSAFKQHDDWLDLLVRPSATPMEIVKERGVAYVWEPSASNAPGSLRMDKFTYLGDTANTGTGSDDVDLGMNYTGAIDSGLSRVTSMVLGEVNGAGGVTVANYVYMGLDGVSKTSYPENDVYSNLQDSSHSFDTLDRFNRITRSRWNRTRTTNEVPFFDSGVHWDDGSNITGITDYIHTDDFNYTFVNDDLDRLTQAKRGAGTGAMITNLREQADWGLGKVGTWDTYSLDLSLPGGIADLDYSDDGEFQADHSFDGATPDLSINQLTTVELDTDDTPGYEATHNRLFDENGNLVDAPERNQKFKWDYLNRLIEVTAEEEYPPDSGSYLTRILAEFRYNALGYRIAERLDSNGDGYLDKSIAHGGQGDDTVWRRLIYDAQWRVVDVVEVDTSAVEGDEERLAERFVHHNAGLLGIGTGSYIDSVVLRDRDADENGTIATPSLEERHYYCQNWRADVVAIIDDSGKQIEQIQYTPYGVPYAIPFADQDFDGEIGFFDVSVFNGGLGGSYDVRLDADLNGVLDFFDLSYFLDQFGALSGEDFGRGVQSAYGHNLGYAGYWRVNELRLSHVRNRWYDEDSGGWLSKDPAGYMDGGSLYVYSNTPLVMTDPSGLDGRMIPVNPDPGYNRNTFRPSGPTQDQIDGWWANPNRYLRNVDEPPSFNDIITGRTELHDWVANNYWRRIYSDPQLIKFSPSRMVVEPIVHSIGIPIVVRFAPGTVVRFFRSPNVIRVIRPPNVTVTQWGPRVLKPGSWVMKGGRNPWNYFNSFKWIPRRGFAWPWQCSKYVVPRTSLRMPNDPGWVLNRIGWLLKQRKYLP